MPGTVEIEFTILTPCPNGAETLEVCIRKARGYLERTGHVPRGVERRARASGVGRRDDVL